MSKYRWKRYTASESFDRIKKGENPFVAHGDFLDDWRRSDLSDRFELAAKSPQKVNTPEERRWAALFAATIELLCAQDDITPPAWVKASKYSLSVPWYLGAKSQNMRRYLRETTPSIFSQHNVFGGDDILDRV